MTLFKKIQFVLISTAMAAFIHMPISAQSTPSPKQDNSKLDSSKQEQSNVEHSEHDHSEHGQTQATLSDIPIPLLDGTYSEIDGDHTYGSTTAPHTMIIYASVTCPHCATWFNTVWPDIKKNYVDNNKLRVVFREFPTPPANIAVIGFQIANCAPEDQYFKMLEYQMKEQENIFKSLKAGTGKETYLEIAKKAGLKNEDAMNTCIQDEAGLERINKAMTLAQSAKISSVPNFIVNGEILEIDLDYKPLSEHLDKLAKRGFTPMR